MLAQMHVDQFKFSSYIRAIHHALADRLGFSRQRSKISFATRSGCSSRLGLFSA